MHFWGFIIWHASVNCFNCEDATMKAGRKDQIKSDQIWIASLVHFHPCKHVFVESFNFYLSWRSCVLGLWSSFSGELFTQCKRNAEPQSGVDQVTAEQSFFLNASIYQWAPLPLASLCPSLWLQTVGRLDKLRSTRHVFTARSRPTDSRLLLSSVNYTQRFWSPLHLQQFIWVPFSPYIPLPHGNTQGLLHFCSG